MAEEPERKSDDRSIKAGDDTKLVFKAPKLPYLPQGPKNYRPKIALIGCGGIAPKHLGAYRRQGWDVVALVDINLTRVAELRNEYYPEADCCMDFQEVLKRDDIDVVDVATHPDVRVKMVAEALQAGKHVLSQKPFVMHLDDGDRLCALAAKHNVKLAVNQNGRWSPHFSYIRAAVQSGLIGTPIAAHLASHWDHNWTADTAFNLVKHLILFDFGIHWYDILGQFLPKETPRRVYASTKVAPGQRATPSLLAQVSVEYDNAQASIAFDGSTRFGRRDTTIVVGTEGTVDSDGPDVHEQRVTLHTRDGKARPRLKGEWFTNGFEGTMGELLCAIEENREPSNSGADNLKGLAICFAAVASAEAHRPMVPGAVRSLEG